MKKLTLVIALTASMLGCSKGVETLADEKIEAVGHCLGAVFNNPAMSGEFRKKITDQYGGMWDSVIDKAKAKCAGTGDNFLDCAEQHLTKKEFTLVKSYGDSVAFINSPQDPSKLPNLEVASLTCMGLN